MLDFLRERMHLPSALENEPQSSEIPDLLYKFRRHRRNQET